MHERSVDDAPPPGPGGDTEDCGEPAAACDAWMERPVRAAEDARTRVGVALSLVELAAQVLENVPPPDLAFRQGDPELFRWLHAAGAMRLRLVGREEDDSLDAPGRESALGDGVRIFEWSEEEAGRRFRKALGAWERRA